MGQVMAELGLTQEQTKILFSYQYHFTMVDINNEMDVQKRKLKQKWLNGWQKSCERFLKNQKGQDSSRDYKLITDLSVLKNKVQKISKGMNVRTPLYLILMETTFFTPYYPLKGGKSKPFKDLKISSKKDIKLKLEEFAKSLRIDKSFIDKYSSSLQKSLKGISGFWTKLLWGSLIGAIVIAVSGGFAAPAVGALLAGGELAGAAAALAGLAALGGGAVAAGGLGMFHVK